MKISKNVKTWFYYNKYYLLLVLVLILSAGRMIWQKVTQIQPDYQMACVTEAPLPSGTIEALEAAFAGLGEDLNGDGRVVFTVHNYPILATATDSDSLRARAAYEAKLMGDIIGNESYFLLLEFPDDFQSRYQSLANPDGSFPPDGDNDGLSKTIRWGDCPALTGLELGTYEVTAPGILFTGENQELLENLYLGRRCFAPGKSPRYPEGCQALWNRITAGVK